MKNQPKSRDSGQALVETALVFMALMVIAMVILDLGRGVYYFSVVYNAAREGARAGIIPADISVAVPAPDVVALNDAVESKCIGLECSIDNIDVEAVYNNIYSPPILKYYLLHVTVSTSFTPVTPFISEILGGDITISSTATMRMEKL